MTIKTVRFFTKPGCHLCEQAEELLELLAEECPIDLKIIDITTDIDVFDRYRYEIPVIAVEGGATVSGKIGEAEVRRVLQLGVARPHSVSQDRGFPQPRKTSGSESN